MVRLEVSAPGRKAVSHLVSRFPCVIGRGGSCDLRVELPGVWGRHAEIRLDAEAGFQVGATGQGGVVLNGEAVKEHRIRNGDRLELGGAIIRFWLAPARARSHRMGEWIFWGICVAMLVGMVTLMVTQPQ